jgi:hypothetical protein
VVAPASGLLVPDAQRTQVVDLGDAWKWPAAQVVHELEPPPAAYWPALEAQCTPFTKAKK